MTGPGLCDPATTGPRILGRAVGTAGEVVLRARGEVVELIVDGVFTMDSAHTETEEALADLAVRSLGPGPLHVVVGGLGLGYTAARLLREPRVAVVEVVELEPALVGWLAEGLLPGCPPPRHEPAGQRLAVRVGDVLDAVPALAPASVDAVLLDVDNGPGFLVHPGNASVYRREFLAAAAAALRPGGVLAVWSSHVAPGLGAALREVCGECEEVLSEVRREGRTLTYATYLARRTGA